MEAEVGKGLPQTLPLLPKMKPIPPQIPGSTELIPDGLPDGSDQSGGKARSLFMGAENSADTE